MKHIVGFLIVYICLSGCANLSKVNTFSQTSLAGLSRFEEFHYGFKAHCLDACRFEAIRHFEISRELPCSCGAYAEADASVLSLYRAIKSYFTGLTNLTAPKVTDYSLTSLSSILKEGEFPGVTIEKKDVDAYTRIAELLLKASTESYRKSKTSAYIAAANEPVGILLDKLGSVLSSNLHQELNFRKEKRFAYYSELELNKSLDEYEKGRAALDYYKQLAEVEQLQTQIKTLVKSFSKIKEGHQKLYDFRNDLTAKELGQLLEALMRDMEELMTAYKKLKS